MSPKYRDFLNQLLAASRERGSCPEGVVVARRSGDARDPWPTGHITGRWETVYSLSLCKSIVNPSELPGPGRAIGGGGG